MSGNDPTNLHRASLVEHITLFCRFLRKRGFLIGPEQTLDALRAIEVVGIEVEAQVREALRLVLCSSPREQELFDAFYSAYFRSVHLGIPDRVAALIQVSANALTKESRSPSSASVDSASENRTKDAGRELSHQLMDDDNSTVQSLDHSETDKSGRSILTTFLQKNAPTRAQIPVDHLEETIIAARMLLNRAKRQLGRKKAVDMRGRHLDFRKTMRLNMPFGGELLTLAWKRPKPKRVRVVLFCDGSRSMTGFAERFLQFAYALTCCSRQIEVFLFSTHLKRVTEKLYQTKRQELPALSVWGTEWGGGTRIGESLNSFLLQHGRRLLGRETVVIIASDGLETGAVETLQQAMKTIHARTASVVWLNPLLAIPGYEPTARGMQAALSYIDLFSEASDPVSFKKMATAFTCRR